MTQDSDATYNGVQLRLGARKMVLTPDEARAVERAIAQWSIDERKASEARQREAGQMWTVTYWRHHVEQTDEEFSLDDAVGTLWAGEEWGNLSASGGSIRCPDGTVIEGEAMWALIRTHGRDDAGGPQ